MSERKDAEMDIDDLAAEAAVVLSEEGVDQASGRVSGAPSPRTIRYYTTHGLLDRPKEFDGRTALYGERHLLQLVAIKRLQARGLTLSEIQERLVAASDEDLEGLAGMEMTDHERAYAETVADTREFWKEAPARADAAVVAEADDEQPPEKPPSVQAPRSEKSGQPAGRIEGARLDRRVTLLLEDSRRALHPDDLEALRAAAAPLIKVLERRKIIDRDDGE